MSKTVEELCDVFGRAVGAEYDRWLNERPMQGTGPTLLMRRAGVEAVVRALRDEIVEDGDCKYCVATTAMYNEILGDAGEKVAGSANTVDAQQCQTTTISVTDPYEPITGVTDYHRGKTVGERLITAAKEAVAIARGEKEPAREYAPVCVWTRADKSKLLNVQWWSVGCVSGLKREGHHSPCSSCGKPIRFVEAKP